MQLKGSINYFSTAQAEAYIVQLFIKHFNMFTASQIWHFLPKEAFLCVQSEMSEDNFISNLAMSFTIYADPLLRFCTLFV